VTGHVVALCGGVGGAKLAQGLGAALPPEELSLIVNTGDDFRHLGLSISPDLDSVIYALAGLSEETGRYTSLQMMRSIENQCLY
jgi:LPPG:FO 2-phospho-L-lactate transferase